MQLKLFKPPQNIPPAATHRVAQLLKSRTRHETKSIADVRMKNFPQQLDKIFILSIEVCFSYSSPTRGRSPIKLILNNGGDHRNVLKKKQKVPESRFVGVAQIHLHHSAMFFQLSNLKGTTIIFTVVFLDFTTQSCSNHLRNFNLRGGPPPGVGELRSLHIAWTVEAP